MSTTGDGARYVIRQVTTGLYWGGWMRFFIKDPKRAVKIARDDFTTTELIRRGYDVVIEPYDKVK